MRSLSVLAALLFFPATAFAHEAYVLSPELVLSGMTEPRFSLFMAFSGAGNTWSFIGIALVIGVGIIAAAYFARTGYFLALRGKLDALKRPAHLFLRIVSGVALMLASKSNSFPGPEAALSSMPLGGILPEVLLGTGVLLTLGFLTEIAALLGIGVFAIALFSLPGGYGITYLSWLGVFLIFLIAGGGRYSLDARLFRRMEWFASLRHLAPFFARITHGLALIAGAVLIKFLHPILTLTVIQNYDLASLPFMPNDPFFILLGVALTELAIGLFIFLGFELRLALLAEILTMTVLLFIFTEPLWPHLIFYGMALYLFFAPQKASLDGWIDRKIFGARR